MQYQFRISVKEAKKAAMGEMYRAAKRKCKKMGNISLILQVVILIQKFFGEN